jgi:hypothetical protein
METSGDAIYKRTGSSVASSRHAIIDENENQDDDDVLNPAINIAASQIVTTQPLNQDMKSPMMNKAVYKQHQMFHWPDDSSEPQINWENPAALTQEVLAKHTALEAERFPELLKTLSKNRAAGHVKHTGNVVADNVFNLAPNVYSRNDYEEPLMSLMRKQQHRLKAVKAYEGREVTAEEKEMIKQRAEGLYATEIDELDLDDPMGFLDSIDRQAAADELAAIEAAEATKEQNRTDDKLVRKERQQEQVDGEFDEADDDEEMTLEKGLP